MDRRETRRTRLIATLADHLLAHGLAQSSLRQMAQAAGTSDRMLLYYFRDKADLLETVIGAVVNDLYTQIGAALGDDGPLPPAEFHQRMARLVGSSALQQQMRLWSELSAAAGRGDQPLADIAERIAAGFATFAQARLDIADPGERADMAGLMLVQIDGAALLEPFARGAYSQGAQRALARLLGSSPRG